VHGLAIAAVSRAMKPPSFRIVLGQSDAVGASLWSTVRTRLPIPSSVPECIRAPARASCRSFELRGRTAPAANVRRPGDSHKDASARLQRIHECASAPKLQRRQAYLFPFGIGWWNTRAAFAFLRNGIPILERRYAMTIQQLNNRHCDWKHVVDYETFSRRNGTLNSEVQKVQKFKKVQSSNMSRYKSCPRATILMTRVRQATPAGAAIPGVGVARPPQGQTCGPDRDTIDPEAGSSLKSCPPARLPCAAPFNTCVANSG